jgi:hypothetical protein
VCLDLPMLRVCARDAPANSISRPSVARDSTLNIRTGVDTLGPTPFRPPSTCRRPLPELAPDGVGQHQLDRRHVHFLGGCRPEAAAYRRGSSTIRHVHRHIDPLAEAARCSSSEFVQHLEHEVMKPALVGSPMTCRDASGPPRALELIDLESRTCPRRTLSPY